MKTLKLNLLLLIVLLLPLVVASQSQVKLGIWQDVLRDYEYGLGISKMIGFEDLMDKVAEVYKGNEA